MKRNNLTQDQFVITLGEKNLATEKLSRHSSTCEYFVDHTYCTYPQKDTWVAGEYCYNQDIRFIPHLFNQKVGHTSDQ